MDNVKLWPIEPHTTAKHRLLKSYLDRWFPILGKSYRHINYIDGFAGPGEYAGGEKGSPIHAIESAMAHVQKGTLAPDVKVDFIFVERENSYAAHLRTKLVLRAISWVPFPGVRPLLRLDRGGPLAPLPSHQPSNARRRADARATAEGRKGSSFEHRNNLEITLPSGLATKLCEEPRNWTGFTR